jgi:hypothetical protein
MRDDKEKPSQRTKPRKGKPVEIFCAEAERFRPPDEGREEVT